MAWQLRKQNELERKKIETEYLRRVLEVLHVPNEAINAAAFEISYHVRNLGKPATTPDGFAPPVQRAWERYSAEIDRFNLAVKVALAFARAAGDKELADALVHSHTAVQNLGSLLAGLMDRRIHAGNVDETSNYKLAFEATDRASDLVVRRFTAIYGS